ncbi:hypothetical protein DSCO28_66480 [Desulfosarcina ovata subsp. sediminis]|uniref:Uncharacterized protein n=2 Tax=Desulfosarcina ovata TaxID=83564 RepID=A0A5K8AK99_9BACT|nr:hypothetical protein DSCO28_66480 [Desulfosarcina ovata subsp. sediminis]BBO93018.1 hypothetical protein DSCOOX_61980 [Desulfosarcina ovata subsp. ovata]
MKTAKYPLEKRVVGNSIGMPQETGYQLTQALTRVTHLGGEAAAVLNANDLFDASPGLGEQHH